MYDERKLKIEFRAEIRRVQEKIMRKHTSGTKYMPQAMSSLQTILARSFCRNRIIFVPLFLPSLTFKEFSTLLSNTKKNPFPRDNNDI